MANIKYTDHQVEIEALIVVYNHYSTYEASRLMDIPQSTLWWHLTVRLKDINYPLWKRTRDQLEKNGRGGGR